MTKWIILALAAAICWLSWEAGVSSGAEPTFAARRESLATVRISVAEGQGRSLGTGVIVSHDPESGQAIALTNVHVIAGNPRGVFVEVPWHSQPYPAEVLAAGDRETLDVAALRFTPAEAVEFVPLADTDPQPGDAAETIGYGGQTGGRAMPCRVASVGRWAHGNCELDRPVRSGDSGSPVFIRAGLAQDNAAEPRVAGIVWGSDDNGAMFQPVSRVRQVFERACPGGVCFPPSGARPPTYRPPLNPSPVPRPPAPSVAAPTAAAIAAELAARLKTDVELAALLRGPPGKDGINGTSPPPPSVTAIAAAVAAQSGRACNCASQSPDTTSPSTVAPIPRPAAAPLYFEITPRKR